MSIRYVGSLLFFFALGCGKEAPPAPPAIVEKTPSVDVPSAPAKKEDKKELAKKVEEPPIRMMALDLRGFGLFAVLDVPEGTRVEASAGTLVFLAGGQGVKLVEGAVDLRELKNNWTKSETFKVIALPIDEPDALLAEVRSGERTKYFARVNLAIDGKPYHFEEYFTLENMTLEKARRIVGWARTLRQTPALRAAQERDAAARGELKKRGAIFPTPSTVVLMSPDDRIFELLRSLPTLLGVTIIDGGEVSRDGLANLQELQKLRHLTLQGCRLSAPMLAEIAEIGSLESLNIDGPGLNDLTVKPLAKLKNLAHLDLSQTRLTDRGLALLQTLENLETLKLDGDNITGAGLVPLKSCKKLRRLGLADSAITDADAKTLLELPSLEEVDLAETDLSENGLKALENHPGLLRMTLRDTHITPEALAKLKSGLPHSRLFSKGTFELSDDPQAAPAQVDPAVPLERLSAADPEGMIAKFGGMVTRDMEAEGKPIIAVDLHGSAVGDADIAALRGSKKLQKLNLADCARITDRGLPYLAGLTALEVLDLRNTAVKGAGLAHLTGLKQLNSLLLTPGQSLTAPELRLLAGLPNLEVLSFTVDEPAYPKLRVLATMAKLKELDLSGIVVSTNKMNILKALKNLEALTLGSKGSLSDRALLPLKELVHLKKLTIPNYTGGDDGLDVFRQLTNLESLSLYGPFITDRGIFALAACEKLEGLRLDRLRISNNALSALRNQSKLVALSLADTKINDRGLAFLKENRELEVLDLSNTPITDTGLAQLKDHEELRSLLLVGTGITGSGFKALDGLPRLRRLVLKNSAVNDTGLEAIGKLGTVVVLDLGGTQVSAAGLAELHPMRMLERLVLDGCSKVNDEAVAALKDLRALKQADLRRTKVSKEAAAELRKLNIQIDIGGD